MSEELNFSGRQSKLILSVAVLFGLFLVSIADKDFLFTVSTVLGIKDFPLHGLIMFDFGDNSCEYYTLDRYFPGGADNLMSKNSEECAVIWEATLGIEKLEEINSSTDDAKINELLLNATKEFDRNNWNEVNRLVDRLQIEREYTVK